VKKGKRAISQIASEFGVHPILVTKRFWSGKFGGLKRDCIKHLGIGRLIRFTLEGGIN